MMTSLDAALDYIRRGWAPVPVPHRSKAPVVPGWQKLRITEADLGQYFNGAAQNIGLLLGKPSGGYADIDCDVEEAIEAAPFFLPVTHRRHGRRSKPRSHYGYVVTDRPDFRTVKFTDPVRKNAEGKLATLVELRGTGGQTIVPPSTHESGERIEWEETGDPATVTLTVLHAAVTKIAAVALLAPRWPDGGRHDASLALAGTLLRGGMPVHDVERFVEALAHVACDPSFRQSEGREYVRAARDTAAAIADGRAVTAAKRLSEILPDGERVVKALHLWLALRRTDERTAATVMSALASLDSFEVATPVFFWKPYIPDTTITVLGGDFGVAKTWAMLAIAAAGSRGWHLPNQDGRIADGHVDPWRTLYLSVENDPASIRFRIERLGGDASKIVVWNTRKAPLPTLTNLTQFDAALAEVKPRLVTIDPIQSVLGAKLDMNKSNEVRAVLDPLMSLARKHGCAVVVIMHLNKMTSAEAKHRLMASVDFGAVARSILIVAPDPTEPRRRVLAHLKVNDAKLGISQTFMVEGEDAHVEFTWCGTSDLTADDILTPKTNERGDTQINGAVEFLRSFLRQGVRPKRFVEDEAARQGISPSTLRRAALKLNVKMASSNTYPRQTFWSLYE